MLARRDQGLETGGFIMPPKADGIMRIALLVPKSGENAVLGNELQRGAELALFSLRNSQIELLVFDTVEKGAGVAAREAVVAEVVGQVALKCAEQAQLKQALISTRHACKQDFHDDR